MQYVKMGSISFFLPWLCDIIMYYRFSGKYFIFLGNHSIYCCSFLIRSLIPGSLIYFR